MAIALQEPVHCPIIWYIQDTVKNRYFHDINGFVFQQGWGILKLGVLVSAKVREKLRLANHVFLVEAGKQVKPFLAPVSEMPVGKIASLGVGRLEYRISVRLRKLIWLEKINAEVAISDPSLKQRADLPIGFFGLRTSIENLFQAHLK